MSCRIHSDLIARVPGKKPKAVGFGISTPEQAAEVIRAGADAAIVGSVCVDLIARGEDRGAGGTGAGDERGGKSGREGKAPIVGRDDIPLKTMQGMGSRRAKKYVEKTRQDLEAGAMPLSSPLGTPSPPASRYGGAFHLFGWRCSSRSSPRQRWR